jgi:hypothetical protein
VISLRPFDTNGSEQCALARKDHASNIRNRAQLNYKPTRKGHRAHIGKDPSNSLDIRPVWANSQAPIRSISYDIKRLTQWKRRDATALRQLCQAFNYCHARLEQLTRTVTD